MKLLSEALGEALALVEKATPGHAEMRVRVADDSIYVCMGDRRKGAHAQGDVCLPEDDVFALVQGLNFLRQHGPAIAAALRAVEGDAVDAARYRWLRDEASKVKGMSPAVIYATEHFDVSSDECGGFEYGPDLDAAIDKARGVPLDAAGSAEGVS